MLALFITVFSTALYLAAVFEYSLDPISWGLVILFSFMQDIDLPASKAGRPLFWLLASLEKCLAHQTITYFLFVSAGRMVNINQIETYYPVICGVDKLSLHYAKAEDLREYLNLTVIRGEVVVHFWLRSIMM